MRKSIGSSSGNGNRRLSNAQAQQSAGKLSSAGKKNLKTHLISNMLPIDSQEEFTTVKKGTKSSRIKKRIRSSLCSADDGNFMTNSFPKTGILFGGQGLSVPEEEEPQASIFEANCKENQSPNLPSSKIVTLQNPENENEQNHDTFDNYQRTLDKQ